MKTVALTLAGVGLATASHESAYAQVRHTSSNTAQGSMLLNKLHRLNAQVDRSKQQRINSHANVPYNMIGTQMFGGYQSPQGYGGLGSGGGGGMAPVVGMYMPPNGSPNGFNTMSGGMSSQVVGGPSSYIPTPQNNIGYSPFGGNSIANNLGHPSGAGQVPQASYPGQYGTANPGMYSPMGGANAGGGAAGPHPFASPNIARPLYMDMNVAPSYWSQPAPNSPIGSGRPSLLEISARAKGDEGQAYWLPPASGDESAGGGGGAAPASPGTSQYSVSPQAFYQGGAGGAGGAAAPASLLETNSQGDDGYYLPPPGGKGKAKKKRKQTSYSSSLLQTREKGDEGQAYWLPPASGDESAGGGGGAAPASPGTSQYSVSPQAFYQGGAGGAGGAAAPASLVEITSRSFPKGVSFTSKGGLPQMQQQMRFQGAPQQQQQQQQQLQPQQQQPLQQQPLQQQPLQQLQSQQPPKQQQQQQGQREMSFASVPQGSSPTSQRVPQPLPPSLSDPSNAFDSMHQSWVPNAPTQAMGTVTPQNSASLDAFTGAGFMALSDPGGRADNSPQLRRL